MKIRALFLCSQLAGYSIHSIQNLSRKISGEIRIFHKGAVAEAPFIFEEISIQMENKTEFSYTGFRDYIFSFNPDIIYVAGWRDLDYLRVGRYYKSKGRIVICGLDNPWTGSLYQHILCLSSPFSIKACFTHMWVAGRSQFHYARQLHFPANRILSGLYSADTNHFKNTLKHTYNKELLFVGRFEKEKGVEDLYRIFKAMSPEEKNGWTLRMIGNGSLKKGMESSSDMFLEPFMQPATLVERTRSAGAFILPSLNEHWGVVVHEFAASALPLVLSEHVNAGEEYLIANYNGFIFRDKGSESLREVLIRLFAMDPADLSVMGARSQELALRFTPDLWAAVFLSTLEAKYQSGINYRSDDH